MTSTDVLERVRQIYAQNGWIMPTENISIHQEKIRGGFLSLAIKKKIWHVRTNVGFKGGSRIFEFDDETGELLKHVLLLR